MQQLTRGKLAGADLASWAPQLKHVVLGFVYNRVQESQQGQHFAIGRYY